jgi:hypothetical protein
MLGSAGCGNEYAACLGFPLPSLCRCQSSLHPGLTVLFHLRETAGSTACTSNSSSSECSQTLQVGSRVKVLSSVSSPVYGWGAVTYSSVGTVTSIQGSFVRVDFPEQSGWYAASEELQVVCTISGCSAGSYFGSGLTGCTSCPAGTLRWSRLQKLYSDYFVEATSDLL